MATLDLGKIKFTWKGAWSISTSYERDDVVSHGGSSWIYVNAVAATGQTPSDGVTTYWNKMSEGSTVLTTSGDLIIHNGTTTTRLAIGQSGQVLKSTGTAVSWDAVEGFEGMIPLTSNIPLYANTQATTLYGEDGKYPWLADYANDWIPQDPFPNGESGPIKRAKVNRGNGWNACIWLNKNHEYCYKGYQDLTSGNENTGSNYGSVSIGGTPMSMEFGDLAIDEFFVRFWTQENHTWVLTNKGNLWYRGPNDADSNGGFGDIVTRHHLTKCPYLGTDAYAGTQQLRIIGFTAQGAMGHQVAGEWSCFAIVENGDVYSWGNNDSGLLGNGNTTNLTVPTKVTGISNAISCQAGYASAWILTSAGAVYHSGANQHGLGQGTARTTFAQLTGVSNVEQILHQHNYSYNGMNYGNTGFALQDNGHLYYLGQNEEGHAGVGNRTQQNTFVRTGGSDTFSGVIVTGWGNVTSCAFSNTAFDATPGDMYLATRGSRTGFTCRFAGHNGQGQTGNRNTSAQDSWYAWDADSTQSWTGTTDYSTRYQKAEVADGVFTNTTLIFKPQNIKAVIPAAHDGEYHGMWYILDMQNRLWYQGHLQYAYNWRNSNDTTMSRPNLVPSSWGHHNATVGTSRFSGKVHVTPMIDLHHSGHVQSSYYHHWMI